MATRTPAPAAIHVGVGAEARTLADKLSKELLDKAPVYRVHQCVVAQLDNAVWQLRITWRDNTTYADTSYVYGMVHGTTLVTR